MANAATSAINLAEIISKQIAPETAGLYAQKEAAIATAGQASADNAAEIELAKANAISLTKNFFEGQGGVDKLSEITTDYMQTSSEARYAHQAATERLMALEDQANANIVDDPLGWFSNIFTFGDNYNATKVTVDLANSKAAEAAVLKDQMMTLNNVTQEVAATTMATAATSSTKTAERLATIAKANADGLVIDTKLKALETGADLKVRSVSLQMQAEESKRADERMAMAREDQAMQRQRFEMDKAKFAEWAAEKKAEPEKVKSIWDAAVAGVRKLKSVDDARARAMLGKMPTSMSELEFAAKKNPAFDGYVRTGFLAMSESPSPYGGTLSEVASTLIGTQATGNSQNSKAVNFIKSKYAQGYAQALGAKPEEKAAQASAFVAESLNGAVRVDAVNKDTNPLRLPAPIMALQGGYEIVDPKVAAMKTSLLASPIVKHLQTSGVLTSDDPNVVLKAAAAFGDQQKISPTLVAETVANLNQFTAAYHGATLAELGIPADMVGKVRYQTTVGSLLGGTRDFNPYDPKEIQKMVILTTRSPLFNPDNPIATRLLSDLQR